MANSKILVIACTVVCVLYGTSANNVPLGPNNVQFHNMFGLTSQPECQQDRFMICMAPMMAFAMSPEAQPLHRHWIDLIPNITQLITEDIFNRLCSIAQTAIPCADDWMNKCAPPEVQASKNQHSRAVGTILSFCNETDSYSKFTKIAICGQRITDSSAMPCIDTVVNKHIGNSSADRLASTRINKQQYICCDGKMLKDCVVPVFESGCTPEEKTETVNFMDRILRAYECTDDLYRC